MQGTPLALCIDLYGLWLRYETHSTFHSGQKVRAEYAVECDCQNGHHERGLAELRRLLRRGRVPLPDER